MIAFWNEHHISRAKMVGLSITHQTKVAFVTIDDFVTGQIPWNRNFFQEIYSTSHAFAVSYRHEWFDVGTAIFQPIFAMLNVCTIEYNRFSHDESPFDVKVIV